MICGKIISAPHELVRKKLDDQTIKSVYRSGYSVITVKSIFGKQEYSDLLYQIVQRRLDEGSIQ